MAVKHFVEAECDVCHAVKNREFVLSKSISLGGPGDGWQTFNVVDPVDKRRKNEKAICGACILLIHKLPAPVIPQAEPVQEAAKAPPVDTQTIKLPLAAHEAPKTGIGGRPL